MGICAHLGDSAVSTAREEGGARGDQDRKSTRLNSSHSQISYAVFCLKKKKQTPHVAVVQRCECAPAPPSSGRQRDRAELLHHGRPRLVLVYRVRPRLAPL